LLLLTVSYWLARLNRIPAHPCNSGLALCWSLEGSVLVLGLDQGQALKTFWASVGDEKGMVNLFLWIQPCLFKILSVYLICIQTFP